MYSSRSKSFLLALLLVTLTRSASADDEWAEIKRRGDEALVAGRGDEALKAYEKVYEAKKDPALLYNMGRAQQTLGNFPAAVDRLEQFEREASAELRAKVPGLAGLLADLRKKVAQIVVVCDVTGATVKVGDKTLGRTPLTRAASVNAGTGKLVITKDGYYDYRRDIPLPAGGVANVDVHLSSKATEGVLLVKSPVVGANVSIDGKGAGTVPTEVILVGGQHKVDLAREGYRPHTQDVMVAVGERREVDITLVAEAPLYKKWWFWTGIGLAIAGGTVAVIALTTEKEPGSGTLTPGRLETGLTF